ncbi:hypothetical protein MRX96_016334 [Rhipicephalus microplus]
MALFCRKRLAALDLDTSDSFDCYDAMGHGLYQQRLFSLSFAFSLYVHCSILVFYLISSDVDHWCRPPADWPLSVAEWRNSAIPLAADGRPSRCTVYKYPGDPNDTDVTTCGHWDYDPKNKKRTVVSTWNLVCKRRISRRGHTAPALGTGALASFILAFETTRHEYRTSYGVTVTLLALMISELWYNVVNEFNLEWFLLQAVFLSPTALAFLTFWFADESPRWLIFARNMASAEAVMLAAAKMNNVPLPITSCLLNAVKAEVLKADERAGTSPVPTENSWANYIPTRALFMFGAYFSVTFTYLVLLQSSVQQSTQTWTRWLSLPSNMLTTLFAYKFIGRVPPLELLIWCFAILGSLVCLLSLTLGDPYGCPRPGVLHPSQGHRAGHDRPGWHMRVRGVPDTCARDCAELVVCRRPNGRRVRDDRGGAEAKALDHMKMTLEPLDYRKPEKRRYSHERKKSHSSSLSRRRHSFWDA